MQNKIQKLFIVLWLLFAIYALLDALYHLFFLAKTTEGLMYLGASALAYFMHRVRKKQYSQED
tara:strand:- start:493 stop:681 length:189 start_codon:yes stop_codon:yes gene_type:complete